MVRHSSATAFIHLKNCNVPGTFTNKKSPEERMVLRALVILVRIEARYLFWPIEPEG